ncbi:MAG: Glu-tRNA(Gln) amidotransferase subunit GatE [Nanoarchaeota archaeon]|nr:Glu-tRNA(Gln) amidotransferase subunit GatE [Nanoarchaeota archaeon]
MTKLIDLNSLKHLDFKKLGLKCGLEIHQQLNTGKLFCSCPCEIVPNDTLNKEIKRKLRFSLSETGDIDKAALNEFKKGKHNIYKFNDKIACLVDLDEEPPKGPNKKALSTAFRIGKMLDLVFFDKLQFMRKLIIDGSVTGGFQRTAMLGFGGVLKTSFGDVSIDGVNLEEDSCRNLERNENHAIYSLDRQGIPLIEITTGPQIYHPNEAQEAAKQIGNILRSFPETKRGLGTIRQDLNVSIIGGSRIEIKGAQNLKLIPQVIEAEIKRQMILISIHEELKERKINTNNFSDKNIYDITNIFKSSNSKVIKSNLEEKSAGVFVIKLNNFKNILGHELHENYRFASEISDRNKQHFPSIKGLFHSDELPKYGIEQKEVDEIKKELKLKENDSFIMLANKEKIAKNSLKYIFEIIEELMTLVPSEVRQVDPKGTLTKFSRPMPGSARMYPETDIPTFEITKEILNKENKNIPELYDKKIARLEKEFKLNSNQIEEILSKYNENEFQEILNSSKIKTNYIYSIIFEMPKEIRKREKIETFDLSSELIINILKALEKEQINKDSLYTLLTKIYTENKITIENLENFENFENYLKENNLIVEKIDTKEIENKIKEIINKNPNAPFGALMGICMKEFQGNVDGKIISQTLKKLT